MRCTPHAQGRFRESLLSMHGLLFNELFMILPACGRCQLRMRPQCIRGPCAPHLSCSRLVSSGISISRDTFAAATAAYSKFLDFAPFRCAIALNLEEHF